MIPDLSVLWVIFFVLLITTVLNLLCSGRSWR